MNITFLVGNGFDKSAGIQSGYMDFYQWYIEQESKNDSILNLKAELKKYIDGNEDNNTEITWSDFEIGLGQYTQKFTVDTVQDFFDCYEDAHNNIIAYLKKQINSINPKLSYDETRLKNNITNFYSELSPVEIGVINKVFESNSANNAVIHFISFNYTNILNKTVEVLSNGTLKTWNYNTEVRKLYVDPKVLNIHGTDSYSPILGVCNEHQIANESLLSVPYFKEIMLKPQSVNAIGQTWYEDAKSLINSSLIICVFGMSLGDSDSLWWGNIIEQLRKVPSSHLIIYWYMKEPPTDISIFNRIREQDKVKLAICDYSDMTDEQINVLKERIHVIINTKRVLKVKATSKENNDETNKPLITA